MTGTSGSSTASPGALHLCGERLPARPRITGRATRQTFPTLVRDVLTNRMSGPTLTDSEMSAFMQWVESIPAPAAPSWVDAASASRGAALFSNATIGCATCHSGSKLTNNLTLNVGTGGAFQVPPLIGVGWRTPLLHDGCATTVADRFGACATTGHGVTALLGPQDVSDLVSYLETL